MPGVALQNVGLVAGWVALEDNWGDAMNANLRALDALVMPRVIDRDMNAPPGSPAVGDAYIVGPTPTGAWASRAGQITRWSGTAWEFFIPKAGWRTWVTDEVIPAVFSGSVWQRADLVPINNQVGSTYTLAATDAGRVVRMNSASAQTVTVPTNASVPIDVGATIAVRRVGAGQVSLSAAGGVTLNVPAGFTAATGRQGATIGLHKVAADQWDITGDLAT